MDQLLQDYLGRRRGLLKALTDDLCELYEACCPDDDDGGDPSETSSPCLLSSSRGGSWAVVALPSAAAATTAPPPGALIPTPPPRPANATAEQQQDLMRYYEAQRRWALAMAAHADAWLASSAALALAAAGATAQQRAFFHVRALRHPSVFEVVSGTAGPEDVHDLAAVAAARLEGEEALAEGVGVPRAVALAALAAQQSGRGPLMRAPDGALTIGPRPSSSAPRVASR